MDTRQTPAQLGYRWPAEWEDHAATWLSWPHNPDTWPGRLEPVVRAFVEMVRALQPGEDVFINVLDAAHGQSVMQALAAAGVELEKVRCFEIPTDDAWVRDHGPIFLKGTDPKLEEVALLDFGFNAWGGKYPPWDRDNAVPAAIAEQLDLPLFQTAFVLEGGSVDGNGAGTLLTTESCLLNHNRGVARTRESVERVLHDYLNAKHVVWLESGIEGDDTDGHVDDIARFVAPDTVVAVEPQDPTHPDAVALTENWRRLRAARDQDGKPLRVVGLPMAPVLRSEEGVCPASYANFYLANDVVLVPVFDAAEDARVLSILGELFDSREVVGIPASDLVVGLGAVHCLTQQQPQ